MKRSDLTPAQRQAVACSQSGQGLVGLWHGAVLNALHRHGLVERERGYGGLDHEYRMNEAGLALRADLRGRVNALLAAEGFRLVEHPGGAVRFIDPFDGELVSRGLAMQKTGVQW